MIKRTGMMLILGVCLLISRPAAAADLVSLDKLMASFNSLKSYTTLLEAVNGDEITEIHYTYQAPGFIRMDFISPHNGVKLVYDPHRHHVKVWPFDMSFFWLTLAPDNSLITDPNGHTVDQSHVGALIKRVQDIAAGGVVTVLPSQKISGVLCQRLHVAGIEISYTLWVNPELNLPVKVETQKDGAFQETVFLLNLEVNPDLPDDIFKPES